ncbi:MAG: hypothetical protein IH602_15525 [Bryobacteraceae bacterium]|nr:hypothetical protein [Bryobacteraceae bacterium]
MAQFCEQCGAPLNGVFCGKCGAKAGSAQPQPPVQNMGAPMPQSAPAKGSSPVLKIIFVVLGVLVILGILGGVGLYWAASKIKDKVETVAAERGVSLKDLAEQGSSAVSSEGGDGCWLLSQSQASQLAGIAIVRAEPNPDADSSKLSCRYYADPDELTKIAQAETNAAMAAMKSSKGTNQASDIQQLERFTKGMIAGAAQAQNSEGLVFEIAVRRGGGKSDWTGVSIAGGALGGMEKIPGLGDQAVMAPLATGIYALKGDNFFELMMPALPGGRQKGVEIARAVLGRL